MTEHRVDFEPIGRREQCRADQSLRDCARQMGIELVSLCGGKGTCGRCKVRLLDDEMSQRTPAEIEALSTSQMKAGYRLACQTYPLGDCRVYVPPESLTTPQRTQVEGLEVEIRPDPVVKPYRVEMTPPSLQNHEADAERLLSVVREQHGIEHPSIDFRVLQELPATLRSCKWQLQASVRDGEIVILRPWPSRQIGLAVDLGTTKIAGYLLDLSTGHVLVSKGVMNPQIAYGEDVIARIAHAIDSTQGAEQLRKAATAAVEQLASDLCTTIGIKPEEIVEVVIVGNTAMHHLLLGLPAKQLALSPYVPAVRGAQDIKARDIGINIAPGAYVHVLPNIAGFVGADHVAVLLATNIRQKKGVVIAIDIGTNTEVCLSCDGVMSSVSCASGPAFEGAHIKHGMRASEGAIEHLRIVDDRIEYQTIGGARPMGLCGSAIIDAVAQLYLAGVLNERGRMNDKHRRVITANGENEFVLVDQKDGGGTTITVTQGDIRQIQLAKGAIRTGIQTLLEANGHSEEDIEEVMIAGAFGSYIDVASAVAIGMLPAIPLNRFRQIGNAAGSGARMALVSREARKEAQNMASSVKYIELAATPQFARTFAQATYLGKYRIVHGEREVRSVDRN